MPAGPSNPEGLLSDPLAPSPETVQEVKGDSIPEEATPVSSSDDPGVAWDLMSSGCLILTGQWAAVAEGKGVEEGEASRVGWGGRQGGWEVAKACPQPGPFCVFRRSGSEWASSADHYPTVPS